MNTKKNLIVWLKRIFSLQTLSLLVAIVGVYIAYKSFIHNQDAKISLELYDTRKEQFINIDDVSIILSIYKPIIEDQEKVEFVCEEEKCPIILPYIHNNSNKSLKNFKCEIRIWSMDGEFDLEDNEEYINPNYRIYELEDYDAVLRFKDDVLHAQSELPSPLNSWYYDFSEDLVLEYIISYDGLDKPIYIFQMIVINNYNIKLSDEKIIEYLETVVYPKNIPSRYKTNNDNYMIVVTNGGGTYNTKKGKIQIKPEYETEIDRLAKKVLERNRRRAIDSMDLDNNIIDSLMNSSN